MKSIIFTDLDGTLLDFQDYSYSVVEPVVYQLQARKIPVVFCSSKTRVEQEYYRQALHNTHPFIVENGSAVFIPMGYFSFSLSEKLVNYPIAETSRYQVVILGENARKVRESIEQARQQIDIHIDGYADLPIKEIMAITHLDEAFAQRAATRDFSETLLRGDKSGEKFQQFQQFLAGRNLSCASGGKFHTVMGMGSDKGKAVEVLTRLYQRQFCEIQTIGLGDSANDLPLLQAVDQGYLVQKPDGKWLEGVGENIKRVTGIGPIGWVKVAESVISV
ncbi:MAG: HAD-IIB family hydrolase [Bacteroidota bacterium]